MRSTSRLISGEISTHFSATCCVSSSSETGFAPRLPVTGATLLLLVTGLALNQLPRASPTVGGTVPVLYTRLTLTARAEGPKRFRQVPSPGRQTACHLGASGRSAAERVASSLSRRTAGVFGFFRV